MLCLLKQQSGSMREACAPCASLLCRHPKQDTQRMSHVQDSPRQRVEGLKRQATCGHVGATPGLDAPRWPECNALTQLSFLLYAHTGSALTLGVGNPPYASAKSNTAAIPTRATQRHARTTFCTEAPKPPKPDTSITGTWAQPPRMLMAAWLAS